MKKLWVKHPPNILPVYLFGSYTDGAAYAKSDLDLAVLFETDIDLRSEMTLQVELSETIGFEEIKNDLK